MFNILLDQSPETVMISGLSYKINTDFRFILKCLRQLESSESKENAAKTVLNAFYFYNIPSDIETAIEIFRSFIMINLESESQEDSEEVMQDKVFDMLFDLNYIYAAFMQVYKIDLLNIKMHWWQFKTLVDGLPTGTKLSDIVEIRSRDVPKDPRQRAVVNRLKEAYKLPGKDEKDAQVAKNTIDSLFAWAQS